MQLTSSQYKDLWNVLFTDTAYLSHAVDGDFCQFLTVLQMIKCQLKVGSFTYD
jgi:hypothetical protein